MRETTVNKFWGVPDRTAAPGLVTPASSPIKDYQYDSLGRLINGWAPGRDRATQTPTVQIDYNLRATLPTVVTTQTLGVNGNYLTSATFYDGLQRPRSTQAPTGTDDGGRLLSDTHYDSLGRVESQRGPYFNSDPVDSTTMYEAKPSVIPSYTNNVYDRASRVVAAKLMANGNEKWKTTTDYYGDQTTVTPPYGGTKTTTVTDARGQTSELDQCSGASACDATNYTYTHGGLLATVKTPAPTTATTELWLCASPVLPQRQQLAPRTRPTVYDLDSSLLASRPNPPSHRLVA